MKVTIQFRSNENPELSEDIDLEIAEEIMQHFEEEAKEHNCSVDHVISCYLTNVCKQIENELGE